MSDLIRDDSMVNNIGIVGKNEPRDEKQMRFMILVSGILFFFGCHNYMQELIMSLPGFKV